METTVSVWKNSKSEMPMGKKVWTKRMLRIHFQRNLKQIELYWLIICFNNKIQSTFVLLCCTDQCSSHTKSLNIFSIGLKQMNDLHVFPKFTTVEFNALCLCPVLSVTHLSHLLKYCYNYTCVTYALFDGLLVNFALPLFSFNIYNFWR